VPETASAITLSVDIPTTTSIANSPPAVSPDGRQVSWVASSSDERTRIWTEALATGVPRELVGTEGGTDPFWSPDGRSIGFRVGGQVKRIEVSTGAIQSIAVVPGASGATWSSENVIVFAARYALLAVPATGGTPTSVATLNRDRQENQLLYPQFLPDNHHFLYVARSGRSGQSGAYVGSLDGKPPTRLFSTTSFVRYTAPGYLLSVREGALVAHSFNPATLVVGPEVTTIVRHVGTQGALNGRFDVSQTGLLAFFARSSLSDQLLRWFDRKGNALGDLTEAGRYAYFRIGLDGQRVVVDRGEDPTGGRSVWVYDTGGRPPTRVTFGGIDEWHGLWGPDAQVVTFMSYRDGPGDIYVKSLEKAAPEEALMTSEAQKVPSDWSADGRFLAYWTDRTDSRGDVWVLPIAPKGEPIPIAETQFSETTPRFSPDGRFIAYQSDETGQMEVFVQPFPPTGAKWQVSVNGGMDAVWSAKELMFSDRNRMLNAVPVSTNGSVFSFGRAVPLFKIPVRAPGTIGFDLTTDGRRLLVKMVAPVAPQPMMIVLNWRALLKK
jgi:Tol biopolymer transport system component